MAAPVCDLEALAVAVDEACEVTVVGELWPADALSDALVIWLVLLVAS